MSTFYVKPEKLDKIAKPIDESKYFQWKETLMDCANQKKEWINFTSIDYKWVPRNEDKNRGLGNNEEDKKNIIPLNSYINYIAMYAPSSLVHDIINESNGNAYIDSKIRSMYQLNNNGSSVFKYFKKEIIFSVAVRLHEIPFSSILDFRGYLLPLIQVSATMLFVQFPRD